MEFSGDAAALSLPAAATPLCTASALAYAPPMGHVPDDSALMLRYKDGDTAAFETLYRRHNDALYRYLLRLCRHPASTEDVFQEVWGKIIQSRMNYRPTAKFTTFIYRVAHNCFIDHVRRNKRHSNISDLDPDLQADASEPPEMLVERGLAKERLALALLHLPEEQRDVFLLHEEAGLGLDDIAFVTGCNRETAKSRLRYAVRKLRDALQEPQ
ncbi:MAG: RNA polymerase sigma factor [Gammaproteobacteria bacterium]|nr:RNA polymerase sigma factor [Gammaproteobacteria bacterium]MDH5239722.1 RNA polymerase sigma factor [Gammaproteobacteria bacterium]MDH5261855.1 RNA polymerase sigma factor [Gammaproteobacteria bacterium]